MPSAGALNPIVDGSITVSSTALSFRDDFVAFGFTEEQILATDVIHIRVFNAPIRYRYAGVTATSATGYVVDATNELELVGKSVIRLFSMIAESTDAVVFYTLLTYSVPPQ